METNMADKTEQRPAESKGAGQQSAQLRYIDRPHITETFADSLTGLSYDGQTLRIEFAVTTLDEVKRNAPVTGRRHPACRPVLTPAPAAALTAALQPDDAAVTQGGTLKPQPAAVK